ncbi:MAG: hypothetical protein MJZ63_00680 [Muribaculaceae bacterium]|nr:hypothetical protein [Muribaculaceae bacterium]
MKKTILILFLLLAVALPSLALDLTWSKYNLNFSVPDGGFEMMSTSTHYERQWEDMLLTVHLYTKDPEGKKDIYSTTLERKAADFNMYEVKKTKIKVKNFDTYAVEGIMPDGTRGLLVNLVSKKSELVVQVVVNYLFGNREMVEDVVKSFAENPDRKPNHETKKQKIKKPDQKDAKPSKQELEEQKRLEKEQKYQEKRRKGEIFDA